MTLRKPLVAVIGSPNVVEEIGNSNAADRVDPASFGVTGAVVGDTDAQTLTNKTLTAPKVEGGIFQGTVTTRVLDFFATALAVNYTRFVNNVAGSAPRLQALGSDADISLDLESKGTGVVRARVGGVSRQVATTTGVETFSNKVIVTPTIASFANANHDHTNAAGGGMLSSAVFALGSGVHRNILCAAVDSAAIANTTTPTAFDNGKVSTTFNAALGAVGATLRLTYCGKFSTVGTPNLSFTLRDTSFVTLATSGTIVTPAGVTDELWSISFLVTTRVIGGIGSIKTVCPQEIVVGASRARLTGTAVAFDFVTNGATTTAIGLYATWGTASASNTIICQSAVIEALN